MSTLPPSVPPSNYPPQPPQQGYQQGYQQQPVYPPPKKKTSPIVWILIGLGAFFFVVILAVVGTGFFVAHKVKQAGFDSELMKRNPGYATVKMMAALNPDVEIVSMDDDKGVVTVRDKKSGKTYSVNFEDAKKGRFAIREDGKEATIISTTGDGNNGAVEIKSADGTVKIGGGSDAKLPAWVPVYPGSHPEAAFSAQSKDGNSGTYSFKTNDPVDKVAKFFETSLKEQGMKTSSTLTNSDGKVAGGMVSGELDGKSVAIILGTEDAGASVAITFKSGK